MPDGNRGDAGASGPARASEVRRRLADQRRDRVLVDRAIDGDAGCRRLARSANVTSAWATASSVPMPVSTERA